MAFRIGRKFAQHTYPERLGGGGTSDSFARNFGMGPLNEEPVPGDGINVPWETIASGASPGANVPITPAVTGRLLIHGVVVLKNDTADDLQITLHVNLDGTTLISHFSTLAGSGSLAMPFLVETVPVSFALHQVTVFVTCGGADNVMSLGSETCTVEIQEVSNPTG